ncbi:oligopeptide/dipeptide ABC transporter ATP-binding protein [Streptacidiphilus sp. MAP12-33]
MTARAGAADETEKGMSTTKSIPAQQTEEQPTSGENLLEVQDLQVHFPIRQGIVFQRQIGAVRAVDGVSFGVKPGESLGLVGESGCGKSTTGRAVTRLLEPTGGTVRFDGEDITHKKVSSMRTARQNLQMIFQDPYSSLNPRHTVGTIIETPMKLNGINPEQGHKKRAQELLEIVGLNPEHYNRYPNEFSGGQRQRIGIARALALKPKLIVADEPVSALDVSIQAQVVNLLQDLQREFGLAFLFIAHDLAVVRHFSERVAVMYLGKIVEIADRETLYSRPQHPYTHALLSAVPEVDPDGASNRERIRLTGDVPSPINPPSGCRFRTRCWKAQDICASEEPPLVQLLGSAAGHQAACHFPEVKQVVAPEETPSAPASAK